MQFQEGPWTIGVSGL